MGKKSRAKSEARDWVVYALLAAITAAVFGQVASHAFINYDDGQLIYENAHVLAGLSASSIGWALTSAEIGWYPLTWLSHMLDVSLWGTRAGMHLLTNALLHLACAYLLFAALRRLTRETWTSAFVAALFAVHPMHVESVAWASERKDTLSTLFAMLALLFYARNPRRKLPVALALAASLAAKQMYVTLPAVLLLLDWWPLGRLRSAKDVMPRIVEKLPLFALSIAGSIAAVIGQRNLNALQPITVVPLGQRFANAAVAYCRYLGKLFVPSGMALPYPFAPIPPSAAVAATLLLAAITAGCIFAARRFPSLLAGWLWFLGVLVPVIGFVQIGAQSLADRYSYFAYIGIFLGIAYAATSLPIPRKVLAAIGGIVVVAYGAVAFHQTRYWRNSETLFTHAIEVTGENAQAEYLLGQTLQMSDPDRAIPHFQRAIAIIERAAGGLTAGSDWCAQSFVGMATAKLVKARALPAALPAREALICDAIANNERALQIDANAPHAQNNIDYARQMLAEGRPPAADPANAHLAAAAALSRQHRFEDALVEYRKVVAAAPQSPEPHVYLALALLQVKHNDEALAELRRARGLDAVQSNRVVTRVLGLPESPANLDSLIARLGGR
jgi:tetratricopeptide (TPR) repeat protein